MAHFAKIENDKVTNVLVIADEYESNGQEFLNSLGLDGEWIQTSYNGNIRTKYAGIGDNYNRAKDRFEPSSPYPSWKWNEKAYGYEAPTPMPDDDLLYLWDEDSISWVEVPA